MGIDEKRILYMGTPEFAVPCLEELINKGYNVVGVVTQPDKKRGRGQQIQYTPVKQVALKYGVPVFQPVSTKGEDFIELLQELSPDLIVVVAFGQILTKKILEFPAYGCINIHASLLPKYRGAAPIHRAVINGERETGVTLMYMSEELDAGDIILQKKIAIDFEANVGEIHDQLSTLGAKALLEGIPLLLSGNVSRIPQDHSFATYAPKLTNEDEIIKWEEKSINIYNQIRGLDPWPGAYTILHGKRLKVWKSAIFSIDAQTGEPGEILDISPEGVLVQTGEGQLLLLELQVEGKRRMRAEEFLAGNHLQIGSKLG